MSAILVKLFTPLAPYLIAIVLLFGGGLYVSRLHGEVMAANVNNAMLAQTNQANVAAIAAYQAQEVKWSAALDTLGAQSLADQRDTVTIDDRIDAQPASADAPVAPVLAAALSDIATLQGDAK